MKRFSLSLGPGGALLACLVVCLTVVTPRPSAAQGVTTGMVNGIVQDTNMRPMAGAMVVAVHEPSGTVYQTETRADGRYTIPGMRLGGPYTLAVTHMGSGTPFTTKTLRDITVNLGVTTDVDFSVVPLTVTETVNVTAESDPVFSSTRTGASTSIGRADIATLPTVSGRIGDLVRLTPQSSGMSIAGQDNRLNNITVDGSYFNNSFGLGGEPGARTGVAPISLESIEQLQVNVAPYDVRQGNFVGANVNTVTRSGTNRFTGSVYHRMRNESFVGTEARGLAFDPGTFDTTQTGFWAGAPIKKNTAFAFVNYEDESDSRPLNSFRANTGGEPVGGSVTRVLASDLTALSSFLKSNFDYDTGSFDPTTDETPQKRFLVRGDYNLSRIQKVSFRYNQLTSSSGNNLSGSASAGFGRRTFTTDFLNYSGSNYDILENIKSGIGEWNAVIGSRMANSLIVGYTTNDESRAALGALFPLVEIQDGAGGDVAYTAVGSEPFTPQNELRYHTFQIKNDLTLFTNRHSFTFGGTLQKYQSENVFWSCCAQGNYVYRSLQDFYTDATDFLANPNRTTSPVSLRRFKMRYSNFPGLDKPLQVLKVTYGGGYVQDEWRPSARLTVMGGLRADVSAFNTPGFSNPNADALTFRDEDGSPIQYKSGELPDTKILWSPRVGFNWALGSSQGTQVRGGTGVFSGQPLYVWISNQLGNTGVLVGEVVEDNTSARPFHPDSKHYWPADVTGAGAASYELDVTDAGFKFPQIWRSNIAVDHRLPWGLVGGVEYIYNHDVNGIYYINANLPAAQATFNGADTRPRWTGTSCTNPTPGPCVSRINNAAGNQVTGAIVMKNQDIGRSWNLATTLSRRLTNGFAARWAYSYGVARNTIDPGSTANASWTGNAHAGDPNNPGLQYSQYSPGHRTYLQMSYSKEYFSFGQTTISAFFEARTIGNASYVFGGDANNDTGSGNDLIYIPRDQSEMNFTQFTTTSGRTFTSAEQAAAFDAYINQDAYLNTRRGEYAERNAVFLPLVKRLDLNVSQDLFRSFSGHKASGQLRIDILNFGNMLNSNWGVGQRVIQTQILNSPTVDTQGRLAYRMATLNNELIKETFQTTTTTSDVYSFMLSFRFTFN